MSTLLLRPALAAAPAANAFVAAFVALSGLLALAGCANSRVVATQSGASPATDAQFCVAAQAAITGSKVPTLNAIYDDYQAFVESKPAPRPLTTRQLVWFEDDTRTRPKMISCKMKTADHIRIEYGSDQVGEDTSCAAVNALTLESVRASLTRTERQRTKFDGGRRVVFDPDTVTTSGPLWLEPFAMTYIAADGALHVKSKGMKNDWLDPRLAKAEPRFKGTRYCHLVAPEYLRRVLLGDVVP